MGLWVGPELVRARPVLDDTGDRCRKRVKLAGILARAVAAPDQRPQPALARQQPPPGLHPGIPTAEAGMSARARGGKGREGRACGSTRARGGVQQRKGTRNAAAQGHAACSRAGALCQTALPQRRPRPAASPRRARSPPPVAVPCRTRLLLRAGSSALRGRSLAVVVAVSSVALVLSSVALVLFSVDAPCSSVAVQAALLGLL